MNMKKAGIKPWGDGWDLNPQQTESQSVALPIELPTPYGGEGGIRTLARFNSANGLANRPLIASWVPLHISNELKTINEVIISG